MRTVVSCIVEGHGDRRALPVLVRRIAQAVVPEAVLTIPEPIRIPKDRLLKEGELERAVHLAAGHVGEQGGVLVLVDADDDCPAAVGPDLLGRARGARGDKLIGVVLAKREFEAWFLAGASSLGGQRGLPADLPAPPDPEAIQGAKEWLRKRMEGSRTYSETVDQPALTAALDLSQARQASASFDKCWREIERLLLSA